MWIFGVHLELINLTPPPLMTSTLLGYIEQPPSVAPTSTLMRDYSEETLPLTPFGTGVTLSHSSQGLGLLLLDYPEKRVYLLELLQIDRAQGTQIRPTLPFLPMLRRELQMSEIMK